MTAGRNSDFDHRSHQLEMMDADWVPFEDFRDCLQQTEIVNVLTLAHRPTLRLLKESLLGYKSSQPASILDIGSGGGDMLRRIWRWARRRGHDVNLAGVDLNPWSKKSAETVTPADAPIQYETSNLFCIESDRRAGFIISSLFTHHLTDNEVVKFLRWMEEGHATQGWFVNDLHRHPLPFLLIRYMTRILRFGPMVQSDRADLSGSGFYGGELAATHRSSRNSNRASSNQLGVPISLLRRGRPRAAQRPLVIL